MSQGYSTQDKLQEAIRILKESGKWCLAQPVEKKPVEPSILMLHKMRMVEARGAK